GGAVEGRSFSRRPEFPRGPPPGSADAAARYARAPRARGRAETDLSRTGCSMKAVFKSGNAAGKNPFDRYVVAHPMGDIIFSEGEIATEMFIIHSGTVELFKSIAGETRGLATLEKRDFCGEMSVVEHPPRRAAAGASS